VTQTPGTPKVRRVVSFARIGAANRYGVHNANVANATRAVMERIFYVEREGKFEPPPQPAPGSLRRLLRKFRRRLKRIAPTTAPISRDEFLDCYKGRKRRVSSLLLRAWT
jgi:hypothetical protein